MTDVTYVRLIEPMINYNANTRRQSQFSWSALIGTLLLTIALGATIYRAVTLRSVPGEIVDSRFDKNQGFSDFHNAVYYPVRALVTGTNPYSSEYVKFHPDDLGYPLFGPTALLIHLPLGFLQVEIADVAYFILNVFLLLTVAALTFRYSGRKCSWGAIAAIAALMILCRPGAVNFYGLQMTLLLVLGSLLALEHSEESPLLSGVGLMLTFCKPTFTIPLMVLMLFRGNIRAVVAGVVLCGISSGVVVLYILTFCGGLEAFIEQVRQQYFNGALHPDVPHVSTSWARVDTYSIFPRWGVNDQWNLNVLVPVATMAFGGLAILFECVRGQKEGAVSRSGLLIILIMLASLYHQPYDCLILWVPIVAIVIGADKLEFGFSTVTKWLLLTCMLLPMYNIFGTKLFLEYFDISPNSLGWRIFVTANAFAILAAAVMVGLRMMLTRFSHVDRNMAKLEEVTV